MQRGVIPQSFEPLRKLYDVLEVDFDPLSLGERVKPILKFVEEHEVLSKYLTPLKQICLLKLVKQLGSVYRKSTLPWFSLHLNASLMKARGL